MKRQNSKAGSVSFIGTVENCQIITPIDKNGDSMGHIHKSYDYDFTPIFCCRY